MKDEAPAKNAAFTDGGFMNCAFTGHRTVKPEHRAELSLRLARAVEYVYSLGVRVFYTGGAVGFDTLAAREVLRFRITHPDVSLRLVLPCVNQDERWSNIQKERYAYILQNAESVEYVADEYTRGCMKERNKRLAELCDVMIAYVYRAGSGSSQTVRMARELGRQVYNISPTIEVARPEGVEI